MGLSDILDSYIYLDLEVDLNGQIFSEILSNLVYG